MTKLQNQIIGLNSSLVRLNIELLYEGEFQYQSGKHTTTSRVYCWLFTDQLVIAKYAQDNKLVHEVSSIVYFVYFFLLLLYTNIDYSTIIGYFLVESNTYYR